MSLVRKQPISSRIDKGGDAAVFALLEDGSAGFGDRSSMLCHTTRDTATAILHRICCRSKNLQTYAALDTIDWDQDAHMASFCEQLTKGHGRI